MCVECGEELAGALSNCTVQLVHSSFAIRNDARGGGMGWVGIVPLKKIQDRAMISNAVVT